MSIDLLRHGDTGQRSYRGQLDDPLTENGWRQLREAVRGGTWDRIVSSSMARCARFAEELADRTGLPLRLDPRLVEYHFGDGSFLRQCPFGDARGGFVAERGHQGCHQPDAAAHQAFAALAIHLDAFDAASA